jgi:hypothetical protein
MTVNAAAHKKQYELLPPEKKARLMETKAEQRHEYLTEEEKKFLQGSNIGIGLFLLLFNRSLCGNIQ